METQRLNFWLIVGAVAGWLSGLVARRGNYGGIGDIVIGIIGAVIAGWLFQSYFDSWDAGITGSVGASTIGAALSIALPRIFNRVA